MCKEQASYCAERCFGLQAGLSQARRPLRLRGGGHESAQGPRHRGRGPHAQGRRWAARLLGFDMRACCAATAAAACGRRPAVRADAVAPGDAERVEALLERISEGLQPSDRHASAAELQALLAASAPAVDAFAAMGLPVLLAVLRDDARDLELVRARTRAGGQRSVAAAVGGGSARALAHKPCTAERRLAYFTRVLSTAKQRACCDSDGVCAGGAGEPADRGGRRADGRRGRGAAAAAAHGRCPCDRDGQLSAAAAAGRARARGSRRRRLLCPLLGRPAPLAPRSCRAAASAVRRAGAATGASPLLSLPQAPRPCLGSQGPAGNASILCCCE